MAAALSALGDSEVQARFLVRNRLFHAAAQSADQPAAGLHRLDHLRRRRAQRIDQDAALGVTQRLLHQRQRGGVSGARQVRRRFLFAFGPFRHPVLAQQAIRERLVSGRHLSLKPLLQGLRVGLFHPFVALRNDHIDAVTTLAHGAVEPVQFLRQCIRTHPAGAEHPHAAAVADGGNDIAAMGEGEQGVIELQALTEFGIHGSLSPCRNDPDKA